MRVYPVRIATAIGLSLYFSTASFAQVPPADPAMPVAPAPQQMPLDIVKELEVFKQYYIAKNYGEAANKLTEIADVLRGLKAKEMVEYLPVAPQGWSEVQGGSSATGISMMGGGSLAKKQFTNGTDIVDVTMMSDNAMVKGMMGMANMAGAMGGEQPEGVETYKGQMLKYELSDGSDANHRKNSVMLMFRDGKTLSIEGEGMTRETGMIFLNATNVDALALK